MTGKTKFTRPADEFHLLFFKSGCEAKDSWKSKLNYYTSQEPNEEKTRKEVSVLEVGGKPQRMFSRENLREFCQGETMQSSVGTGSYVIRTGLPEVEGKERYANQLSMYHMTSAMLSH